MSGVAEIAAAAGARGECAERLERVVRALRISGRRLLRVRVGWGVMSGMDRRQRPRLVVEAEDVDRLAREGAIRMVADDVYVLADVSVEPAPAREEWAYIAAGIRKSQRNAVGGFAAMAVNARKGLGPLTPRHVEAGMKLIADAERQEASGGLTMDWDAGPVDRQRRGASAGGMAQGARAAASRFKRVRAAMDDRLWRIAYVLCVGGLSVRKLRTRFGLGQGKTNAEIAVAMEALARAYEG